MKAPVKKFVIRTSDRGIFRSCRHKWDFSSKIRLNYEYVPSKVYFDFGTGMHAGMEVLYDPSRWPWNGFEDVLLAEAEVAFMDKMNLWKANLRKVNQWDATKDEWNDHVKLGKGMLSHYMMWAPGQDTNWEPIHTEIEFEVPIPVPEDYELPVGFASIDGRLHKLVEVSQGEFEPWPVVYQGRIDLIMYNKKTKAYWVWDHKTCARFDSTEHLELDTQCGSYDWACRKMLGINIEGVIYQELRKAFPDKPATLKNGGLSKNKSQSTTVELYEQAIVEGGHNRADYEEFLETLRNTQTEYFRRIPVHRNAAEIATQERNILEEALDMIGDPRIYPNPSKWNCGGCPYHGPCVMRQDGSDWQWYLDNSKLYAKRS